IGNGTLTVQTLEAFGTEYPGTASYLQTGGTNHVVGTSSLPAGFLLGREVFGSAAATMTAGTLLVDYEEYVGWYGQGTFNQSGGSNQALYFTTGFQPGSFGTASLS